MYYEKEGILEDKESFNKRKSNYKRVLRMKNSISDPELARAQEAGYKRKMRRKKGY